MGFRIEHVGVDQDVMYGDDRAPIDSSCLEYFVDKVPPPFQCPMGNPGVLTQEDCLVGYRDGNLISYRRNQKTPLCYQCQTGERVRADFAEEEENPFRAVVKPTVRRKFMAREKIPPVPLLDPVPTPTRERKTAAVHPLPKRDARGHFISARP